jgi:hypothetical protein
MALVAGMGWLVSGCWKTEFATLPATTLEFTAQDAPEGWLITPIEVDLECPNGENARYYFVYPTEEAAEGAALEAAVVYHSGAFDFVFAPTTEDPLAGTHFSAPNRLDHAWAIRHVFATLGMLPNEVETEVHTGTLPVALAEANIAMLFAPNCWGDLWRNRKGQADNDFPSDLFARDGRTAAEWGYQFLADPVFAQLLGVELPATIQVDKVYAIGLAEGGRAVGELLVVDNDQDGQPDHTPAGILVDSSADDLGVYYADPSLNGNTIAGLNRIFPGGAAQTEDASLAYAPLPARTGYLYSVGDNEVPYEAHRAVSTRLLTEPTLWQYVDTASKHLLLNDDIDLARAAVIYLQTGNVPDGGPGVPVGADGETGS